MGHAIIIANDGPAKTARRGPLPHAAHIPITAQKSVPVSAYTACSSGRPECRVWLARQMSAHPRSQLRSRCRSTCSAFFKHAKALRKKRTIELFVEFILQCFQVRLRPDGQIPVTGKAMPASNSCGWPHGCPAATSARDQVEVDWHKTAHRDWTLVAALIYFLESPSCWSPQGWPRHWHPSVFAERAVQPSIRRSSNTRLSTPRSDAMRPGE